MDVKLKDYQILVYLCSEEEDINASKKRLDFLPHKLEEGACTDGLTPLYAIVRAAHAGEAVRQLVIDLACKHIRPERIIIK